VVKAVNGTPVRVRDLATVVQAPKVRLGQLGKAIRKEDGTVLDDDDVVEGIVLLRKGAEADTTLDALHEKIAQLNTACCHPGSGLFPILTAATCALHHPHGFGATDGRRAAGHADSVSLSRNVRSALIVTITIPFSLLVRGDSARPEPHSGEPAVAGGAGFRPWFVDGSVVMVENILRHMEFAGRRTFVSRDHRHRRHEVQKPVFFARIIIIVAYCRSHAATRGGAVVPSDGMDRRFALWARCCFALVIAPGWQPSVKGTSGVEEPGLNCSTILRSNAGVVLCPSDHQGEQQRAQQAKATVHAIGRNNRPPRVAA